MGSLTMNLGNQTQSLASKLLLRACSGIRTGTTFLWHSELLWCTKLRTPRAPWLVKGNWPVMREEEAAQVLSDFAQYVDNYIIRPAVSDLAEIYRVPQEQAPKRPWEMIGEYLREASVLILILVPIDLLIPKAIDGKIPMQPRWLVLTLLLSMAMLFGGMWAERKR